MNENEASTTAQALPVTEAESAALGALADAGQILGAHALSVTAEQDAAIEAGASPLAAFDAEKAAAILALADVKEALPAPGGNPVPPPTDEVGNRSGEFLCEHGIHPVGELEILRCAMVEGEAHAALLASEHKAAREELEIAEAQRKAAGESLAESRRTVAALTAQNHGLHSDNERLRLDVQGLMHQLSQRAPAESPAISLPGDAILSQPAPAGRTQGEAVMIVSAGYMAGILHLPGGTYFKGAKLVRVGEAGALDDYIALHISSQALPQLEEGQTIPTVRAEYVQACPGQAPAVSFVPV